MNMAIKTMNSTIKPMREEINPKECIITGQSIDGVVSKRDKVFQYEIQTGKYNHVLKFCTDCLPKIQEFIGRNKTLIKGHLFNGLSITQDETKYPVRTHYDDMVKFLVQNPYNKTPMDKLNDYFFYLASRVKYAGQKTEISDSGNYDAVISNCYFETLQEFYYYTQILKEQFKYITVDYNEGIPETYSLTFDGLQKYYELTQEGSKSSRCFIAMSFNKEDEHIFTNAIQPICQELGFDAIRVDKRDPEKEQTINDFIIAEIKKCKFLISDYSNQKSGVYFEAGYALGRGKKVIYTCPRKELEKLHFDINHFPVLLYDSIEDLKQQLKAKIESYIID